MNEHQFFSINENDINGKKVFISEAFDSESNGTVWHRLTIASDTEDVTVSIYASDTKEDILNGYWKCYQSPKDMPLFEYRGRYIWIKLEFKENNYKKFRARIYYPANSFVRYLPSIYQDTEINSFFSRFIALFQNIYLDIDELIMEFPKLLDPLTTDKQHLRLLYEWLSCEEYQLLPASKRGEFLLNCTEFYQSLGTKSCMVSFIEWLCGQTPLIIEHFEYKRYIKQEHIKKLYKDKPLLFTVIISDRGLDKAIIPLIDKFKPAYTECNLVILKDLIVLDGFSYLGVNSYI